MRHARMMLMGLALVGLTACAQPLEKYRKEGIKLYEQDQYDQSLQVLNKALSYDQFDAQANTYAGLVHYRAGHYEQALYHFKVALQADPSSEKAKNGLAAAMVKLGRPDEALDYLERLAAVGAQAKDPRREKSDVRRFYLHQTEENLFLGKGADRQRIGKTYELLGDYDNALVYYKRGLEVAPNDGRLLMAIAGLYEKTGNTGMAREYLARAYRADPRTPGLTEAMTRNHLAISDVVAPPAVPGPLVPAGGAGAPAAGGAAAGRSQ
jgi:tetratricopeptide (TPR) repeat protein